jgi:hypothetical protein
MSRAKRDCYTESCAVAFRAVMGAINTWRGVAGD